MQPQIAIDRNKCIKCLKCVRVCPAAIFSFEKDGQQVVVQNEQNCIVCGHCVAACPTCAVIHSDFPAGKVHPIDQDKLPEPAQIMELILARRSNRAFTKQPVPRDMLDLIVEAAHRAPTASNMQQVHFTLVTDPVILREISSATIDILYGKIKKLSNPVVRSIVARIMPDIVKYYPRFLAMKQAHDKGADPVLRGATAILFIHSPRSSRFGCQDCNLAYQNGSLMAESLGVSQFYTGFVCNAVKQDGKNRIPAMLGTDEVIHAGLALGMPSFRYPNYIDRKELKINIL